MANLTDNSLVKVGFISLGCSKNLVDTEVMLRTLHDAGFVITPEETEAVSKTAHASVAVRGADKREKRTQLLSALRPYVSEKRGKTIDTLLGAMDLWDLVGRG